MLEILLGFNLTVMVIVSIFGFMYAFREIKKIHSMLNSRLSEIISMASTIAHSAGVEEERGRAAKERE